MANPMHRLHTTTSNQSRKSRLSGLVGCVNTGSMLASRSTKPPRPSAKYVTPDPSMMTATTSISTAWALLVRVCALAPPMAM
jgi:hypothetical protein